MTHTRPVLHCSVYHSTDMWDVGGSIFYLILLICLATINVTCKMNKVSISIFNILFLSARAFFSLFSVEILWFLPFYFLLHFHFSLLPQKARLV